MAMHGDVSPQARERAGRTVGAAAVFAEHAEHIEDALPLVAEGYVLVAVVDHAHEFSGTHHVAQEDLVERVPELEGEGGWAMVFTAGSDAAAIRARADKMADLAQRRLHMIDRILSRRN